MHQASVSSCSISPRCPSARPARAPPNVCCSQRPGTGGNARLSTVASRPGSSSTRQATELFHLTRPPSGNATSRSIASRQFDEDVVVQRNRLSSARSQRTAEALAGAPVPCKPPGVPAVSTQVEDPFEVPHWTNESQSKQPERTGCTEPDGTDRQRPFSPFAILRTLQRQSSLFRRPSKVPTPPLRPPIEDLIDLGNINARRRTSLFSTSTHSASCGAVDAPTGGVCRKHDSLDVDEDDDPHCNSGSQLDLADARTGFLEEQFLHDGRGSRLSSSANVDGGNQPYSSFDKVGNTSELMSSARAYDARATINPQHARKRAYYQKLNDIAMIHAGVQLLIPSLQNIPHYQTLHPMEFAREVNCDALPLPLRAEHSVNSNSHDQAPPNRGFLTVAQLKREKRSTNFVMPQLYNPGPIEATLR